MAFPATRLRRLRKTGVLRDMVRETELTPAHLFLPMFVQLGEGGRTPIQAMPGVERLSISNAIEEAGEAHELGIPAALLFGLPAEKDEQGSGAYDDEGVVQLAVRALKEAHPELVVITDVCLCGYTSHGHCGVVLEALLDVSEGADVVMVKPALPYLDVIRRVKEATRVPVAAYNVSGEYAMVKAAAAAGQLDERATVLEALTGIRRAGADLVITYHAKDVAEWLR